MKKLIYPIAIALSFLASLATSAQQFLSQQALLASAQQNFAPALQELTAILQQTPNNELALGYRANIYNRQGNFQSAFADVQAVLAANPKNLEALLAGGLAKTGLKDYPAAIIYFDNAIKVDPKLAQALFFRGRTHLAAGSNQLALADLDAFIKLQANNWEARYLRSIALTILKRYELALSDLKLVAGNNKADTPIGKASADAIEKVTALVNKQKQDELMLKEVGDFYTIYRELELLEKTAKPFIEAIDPLAKADSYLSKANAMEKAVPHIDKIIQYINLHQKTVDAFTTDEGGKAQTRWALASQRWTAAKERNSAFEIANYRFSGNIYHNIAAYPSPAGYTDARKNNDRAAFEAHQQKDLKHLTENLQVIKDAMQRLAKISPGKYASSQDSYQKTYQITLGMIETVKKAKF